MGFEYDRFDIIEVAQRCGIQFHQIQRGGAEFTAQCPFCGDTKYHLGLNRQKERFFCFRCKASGNSVTLYAKLHGIGNREAYRILKGELETMAEVVECHKSTEIPVKTIEYRHDVYYDFLNLLRLSTLHRQNLELRGLTFAHIHQFMYRSIPTDEVFRREVLENLAARHDLHGIPGFWYDERGDAQMYCKSIGGMFIPVCDKDGYIQGLQMRLDVSPESGEKKFRWFSSRNFPNGAGAKSWIHVVGDTASREACVTEGAMKADIASVLTGGRLFIAVPGVNALANLPEVLRELRITKVYEAFDMDKRAKPEVKQALLSLRRMLGDMGIACEGCAWDPRYKGIDDYVYARSMNFNRTQVVA